MFEINVKIEIILLVWIPPKKREIEIIIHFPFMNQYYNFFNYNLV